MDSLASNIEHFLEQKWNYLMSLFGYDQKLIFIGGLKFNELNLDDN